MDVLRSIAHKKSYGRLALKFLLQESKPYIVILGVCKAWLFILSLQIHLIFLPDAVNLIPKILLRRACDFLYGFCLTGLIQSADLRFERSLEIIKEVRMDWNKLLAGRITNQV